MLKKKSRLHAAFETFGSGSIFCVFANEKKKPHTRMNILHSVCKDFKMTKTKIEIN